MASPTPLDPNLLRCWKHQDCTGCLEASGCSWCPFVSFPYYDSNIEQHQTSSLTCNAFQSWSCVPNNYTIPALAPAFDVHVCPHWAERWEVRTRPLGCQVSTITSLTSIVSIASTIVLALVVALMIWLVKRLRRYHEKQEPGWWKVWEGDWRPRMTRFSFWAKDSETDGPASERRPLLED